MSTLEAEASGDGDQRGKACEARMINEGELINYIEQGWEILRDIGPVCVSSVGINLGASLWEAFE